MQQLAQGLITSLGDLLQHFWQWYTSVPDADSWGSFWDSSAYHEQLIIIASVAVVVWTGGLIAYQIKQYAVQTSVGLDLLQNAYMGPVFALVESELWLRWTVTLFWFWYLGLHLRFLYMYRTFESSKKLVHKKYPDRTDDNIMYIQKSTRVYSWSSLLIIGSLYPVLIMFPTHAMMAFGCLGFTFFGLQVILYVLASVPDKTSLTEAIAQGAFSWLSGYAQRQEAERKKREALPPSNPFRQTQIPNKPKEPPE